MLLYTPMLSIIIVNYNGKRFLRDCFESIQKLVTISYEIIVVDNASSDGSAEYIAQNFPYVVLIESISNLGFGKGNNLGSRYAKGQYLLLLNNDTRLLNNIQPAIALFEQYKNIGVLGVKMVDSKLKYRFSCGYFPTPLRLIFIKFMFKKNGRFKNGDFLTYKNQFYSVDWIEGSFFLTTKKIWEKLDGFDEDFFMYGEDVDFCHRVKKSGYRVLYYPLISYVHFGGYNEGRMGLLIQGFRKYHMKHSGFIVRSAANLILTIGLLVRILFNMIPSMQGSHIHQVKVSQCWWALRHKI